MIFFPENNEAYLGMFNKGLYVTLSIVFKGHDYAVFVSKSNFSNLMLQWLIRVFSTVRRTFIFIERDTDVHFFLNM